MIEEIEFTRTDDGKNDQLSEYITDPEEDKKAKASTQMRYSVQYMARGTQFCQSIYVNDNTTPEEIGALLSAFAKWFTAPKLGGMSSKGFGFFDAVTDIGISVKNGNVKVSESAQEYIDKYDALINSERDEYIKILESGGKK